VEHLFVVAILFSKSNLSCYQCPGIARAEFMSAAPRIFPKDKKKDRK